jgi:ABC-type lipoprotein export system ATPase subunit
MRLLTGLTRDLDGTLVLVTHSRWIASMADRRLALQDGRLAPDEAEAESAPGQRTA